MTKIEQLQAEVGELREAVRLLMAVTTTTLAVAPNSAEATKLLASALRDAETLKPRSDTFWEFAAGILKMLSSKALQQHPDDAELLEIHHGVRQSPH
jgi:hypothetical protein